MSAKIVEISKSVCMAIAEKSEQRYTGKLTLVVEVNLCNGGITDSWIEAGTRQRVGEKR